MKFWDRFFQGALQGMGELQDRNAEADGRGRGEFKEVLLSNVSVKGQVDSWTCAPFAPIHSNTDLMARAGVQAAPQACPWVRNEENVNV